jgi:hypothetical protein
MRTHLRRVKLRDEDDILYFREPWTDKLTGNRMRDPHDTESITDTDRGVYVRTKGHDTMTLYPWHTVLWAERDA